MSEQAPALLAGIRVLDFTRVIAGPHGTRILADFGAEVIKVEEPVHGDHTRSEVAWGRNVRFLGYNYGKKSISIDLKHPDGIQLIYRLVEVCDVVAENFRPGVMDRLGIGYHQLREINPRIIFCSISGFGQTGPAAGRPLHAPMAHAISGILSMRPGRPQQLPGAIGDPITAVHAVAAICAALYYRERTGHGQQIDLSILDVVYSMMGPQAEGLSFAGGRQSPVPMGDVSTTTVPTGMFEGRDGFVIVGGGVEDPQWQRLARVIGRPDLSDRRHSWRVANQDEVYRLIRDWVASIESVAEVERILSEAGIVAGKVRSVEESVRNPVLRERGMIQPMIDPLTGPFEATGTPFHFSETPTGIAGLPPGIGEHNEWALTNLIGLDAAEIADLAARGVIWSEPRPANL